LAQVFTRSIPNPGVPPCSTNPEGQLAPISNAGAADRAGGFARCRRGFARTRALLEDIAALSDKISCATAPDARKPSFAIRRRGTDIAVRFAGIPLGHEFTSLVLALLQVGGHPVKIDAALAEQVKRSMATTASKPTSRCILPELPGHGAGAEC
jgi:hypothetical protein